MTRPHFSALRLLAVAGFFVALVPLHAQGDRGIQHIRPLSRLGLNIFEEPKQDTTPFGGLRVSIGGGFAQEFQALTHSTDAPQRLVNGVDANALTPIGAGFNTAMANLYVNVQVVKGVRVALASYLSSRNHNETWVKDGYIMIDESPWDVPALNSLMQRITVKVGHFELNYGDAHFRRTDGGSSLYNPFVGNMVLDAFTTEIGAEAYYRDGPWLAMLGMTGGEIKGNTGPGALRSPTYLTKFGWDRQVSTTLRARLTASSYFTARSVKNTLYTGDRAGTHYHDVMDNTTNNWSGNLVPLFASNVAAIMLNPFVKVNNLELFGTYENANGGAANEPDRRWQQAALDVVYRVANDRAYVAARWNDAKGRLPTFADDVGATRLQFGVGLFVTDNILGKLEYVTQSYRGYPSTDRLFGGQFKGLMLQGAVLF